ncbi:hypothetical protein CRX72_03225 [Pantoea sp. BRM17]|nr:hypothetical protein CRX72_03225 [Pantoea sp. BRM17]
MPGVSEGALAIILTIRDLAAQAGVSTTTVLRFCRKLHCDGWSEFRIRFRLAQEQTPPAIPSSGAGEMLSFFKSIHNAEFCTHVRSIISVSGCVTRPAVQSGTLQAPFAA